MTAEIAVFGLGYVGTVSAACFADRGHRVIGVDINPDKVNMVNEGKTPVLEDQLGELIASGVSSGRLAATMDVASAVERTCVALVCVGTPSNRAGGLSTESLERVADQIGLALGQIDHRYSVVIRSTVLPGTTERVIIPRLESRSGKRAGDDFGVCVNPEFLREGSSVRDFYDPPKTVVGELDEISGNAVVELYSDLPGPLFRVPINVAECTKYADNSFHALKVAFANELGAFCKAAGVDSHEVMRILTADTKLNISPSYLTPGFAFGGSCLPKDVRAIVHAARHLDVSLPLLESVLPSNDEHLQRVYEMVLQHGSRRIGMLGLSFKSGTDDLRESPLVALAEMLVGRGFDLRIWDEQVQMSTIFGANRAYVEGRIPHLSRLMATSADAVVTHGELLILGTSDPGALAAIRDVGSEKTVIDVVRPRDVDSIIESHDYDGVGW